MIELCEKDKVMKVNQDMLIEELLNLTNSALEMVDEFKSLSHKELNYKPSNNQWSILECVEHLNLYGKFYLPEIENQLKNAQKTETKQEFKSSALGDYFVGLIKADNPKKMKATKMMDATDSDLDVTTIDLFMEQLETLKELIVMSKKVNLKKVKTAISLTKLVKLRLGDTFRFLVYHNERHLLQAKRVMELL